MLDVETRAMLRVIAWSLAHQAALLDNNRHVMGSRNSLAARLEAATRELGAMEDSEAKRKIADRQRAAEDAEARRLAAVDRCEWCGEAFVNGHLAGCRRAQPPTPPESPRASELMHDTARDIRAGERAGREW